MTNNPHIGSSLDDSLEEDGVLAEVNVIAFKRVHGWQNFQEKQRITQNLENAYEEQTNDPEFQEEVTAWDVTVGDGLTA